MATVCSWVAVLLLGCAASFADAVQQPNVLVLFVDDLAIPVNFDQMVDGAQTREYFWSQWPVNLKSLEEDLPTEIVVVQRRQISSTVSVDNFVDIFCRQISQILRAWSLFRIRVSDNCSHSLIWISVLNHCFD